MDVIIENGAQNGEICSYSRKANLQAYMSRIQQFFTERRLKPNTKKIYAISLRSFFRHIYDAFPDIDSELLADRYLTEQPVSGM
jgi:hypothetical protein